MDLFGWLTVLGLLGVMTVVAYAACRIASDSEDRERYWQHPPDDDDGIALLKDEVKNDAEPTESD